MMRGFPYLLILSETFYAIIKIQDYILASYPVSCSQTFQ